MNYYVLNSNNEIALFNTDKKKIQNALKFKPEVEDAKIHQTTREIVEFDGKPVFADEHESEIVEQEQIEKDKLEQQEAAAYLNELKELAQSAQLMGNSEWYAEIQAEYQSIVNGE